MLLPKLIAHHLKHGDDPAFYVMQARDAIAWLRRKGVPIGEQSRVLDLGCGHGVFGGELVTLGCQVSFSDEQDFLLPEWRGSDFRPLNVDTEDLRKLGEFDLVICSNVLEHLSKPARFLASLEQAVKPGGYFYLSWTNWLSPWGGHEFSPFHYLGPKLGPQVWDRLTGRKRKHTPYENLFPTSVGNVLQLLRKNPKVRLAAIAPRYYPELSLLGHLPILREFLMWNCAILLQRNL